MLKKEFFCGKVKNSGVHLYTDAIDDRNDSDILPNTIQDTNEPHHDKHASARRESLTLCNVSENGE